MEKDIFEKTVDKGLHSTKVAKSAKDIVDNIVEE